MNEEVIRLEDILDVLIKRWKMIVSITLIAAIFSAIFSFFILSPKYKAGTKVFIGKENSQDQTYNNNDIQMYQRLLKTYAEVIKTNDLIEKAIKSSDLKLSSGSILSGLTVTPRADTQILEISYTGINGVQAKEVVELITKEFIKSATELIPNGNVKVIESVKLPGRPISPNKKMNIIIAFLLGLMGSVALSFLLEFIDNTFKTKEQLEEILGLPVIGVIPDEFL